MLSMLMLRRRCTMITELAGGKDESTQRVFQSKDSGLLFRQRRHLHHRLRADPVHGLLQRTNDQHLMCPIPARRNAQLTTLLANTLLFGQRYVLHVMVIIFLRREHWMWFISQV